jgi:hypothetical protein
METNFNSAVQAGVMQSAVANSFPGAGALTVMGADPVQSQRFAVATAALSNGSAYSVVVPATETAAPQGCPATFKEWVGVGTAFIIVAGVSLLALIGLIMFRVGMQYAMRVKPAPGPPVGVVVDGEKR